MSELSEKKAILLAGGGAKRTEAQHAQGKLSARERLNLLFDAESFQETDAFMRHRATDFGMDKATAPSDGVICGFGTVEGRPVCAFAQDFTVLGGSIGEAHTRKIRALQEKALMMRVPIVGMYDSGGARIQEGVLGLAGLADIFRMNTLLSGIVPQISAIMGPCAGGAVYSPALTDFIFQVKGTGQMYITGPEVIKAVIGETITKEELGGSAMHARKSGVTHLETDDDASCIRQIRKLLSYLPSSCDCVPPHVPSAAIEPGSDDLSAVIPESNRRAYDMHRVIALLADPDSVFELQPDFAANVIVCLIRMDGRVVGVIANQPTVMAGCLDIDASDKAARFIRFCDAFGISLLTLVDVPGYLPGSKQEFGGIIRHGAKLLYSYSEATVPKVTLVVRKAYGGAYIAMSCLNLGADIVYALPTSEIAVMGAEGAADIIFRKEIAASADPQQTRSARIEEYRQAFSNPYVAAELGYISDVLELSEVRTRIAQAFALMQNKRTKLPEKRHGNIPL